MFEPLYITNGYNCEDVPWLATGYEWTDDKTLVFTVRDGVTWSDGEPFTADDVVFTFNLKKENPALDTNGAWTYLSEVTASDNQVSFSFSEVYAPGFYLIADATNAVIVPEHQWAEVDDPVTFVNESPVGTGPFQFESWERGQQVTLTRYDDYWGETAKIDSAIIRTIPDGNARLQALRNGDIDGYDLVAPGDIEGLEADGFTVMSRDPFTILYLGFNQAVPELADIRVRQAIAHAIDKEAVVSQSLPEGTEIATQFIPPTVDGWNPDVPTYPYDPERAQELLAEAGVEDLTLQFNYPTDVSRPYMPTPEDTYTAIASQLEAAGITVEPVADRWSPDYLDRIQGSADHGIHLLGWTGDYNDTDNFLGVFFGQPSNEWGFDNPELFAALTEARGVASRDEQTPLYEEINAQVMEFLPGVPIAHPAPSLAFAPEVEGYQPSPVNDEVWNVITINE
jgi:peptide/nickel transport system substrate-binding protein